MSVPALSSGYDLTSTYSLELNVFVLIFPCLTALPFRRKGIFCVSKKIVAHQKMDVWTSECPNIHLLRFFIAFSKPLLSYTIHNTFPLVFLCVQLIRSIILQYHISNASNHSLSLCVIVLSQIYTRRIKISKSFDKICKEKKI